MEHENHNISTVVLQLKYIAHDLSEVKKSVEDLKQFKWKVVGAGTLVGIILTVLTEIIARK